MNAPTLPSRVVVVTGGGSGIGRATALEFARQGDFVAVWDVEESAGQDTVEQIHAVGGDGLFCQVDVCSADQVKSAMDTSVGERQRLDVLVNNAGIARDALLVKWKEGELLSSMSEKAFDQVVDVNLKGVFLCTKTAVPWMLRSGGGVVLNASSVVALTANIGQTNYAATKSGVIAMTRVWARELGRHQIRVNAVAPGFIQTEMLSSIPEKQRQMLLAKTPLGRVGKPEDVACAYRWLASDEASFVTGTVLSVDGGAVLGT